MNKLSKILLAKNKNISNKFDRHTLIDTKFQGKKSIFIRKKKFFYVALTMLSINGPNTEDRLMFRRIRCGIEGGVVDLAQEKIRKRTKFKKKKAREFGRGHNLINPKYREKAAKIVQAWWRGRKEKYEKILEQIIKIQSAFRGKFVRKYIYDIIFMSYSHQKFVDIINRTLVNHVRQKIWNEFFSRKKLKLLKEEWEKLLAKNDNK